MSNALNITLTVIFMISSYLIGSIPFGLIIGKLIKKVDIRQHGSKNIGSTNAIRVLGKKLGFFVFFLDVLKGMIIIILVRILVRCSLFISPLPDDILYGIPAILGHVFSIFLKFKGGKAVATSLGVVLVVTPIPAILCLIAFLILLYTTGYVCLASTAATITVVTSSFILYFFGISKENITFFEFFIKKPHLLVCILYLVMGLLIIIKHKKNYIRLIKGEENNFKKKKNLDKEIKNN